MVDIDEYKDDTHHNVPIQATHFKNCIIIKQLPSNRMILDEIRIMLLAKIRIMQEVMG